MCEVIRELEHTGGAHPQYVPDELYSSMWSKSDTAAMRALQQASQYGVHAEDPC